jgi:hypothetical protein
MLQEGWTRNELESVASVFDTNYFLHLNSLLACLYLKARFLLELRAGQFN